MEADYNFEAVVKEKTSKNSQDDKNESKKTTKRNVVLRYISAQHKSRREA